MLLLNEIFNLDDRREAFYMLVDYYISASDDERERLRKTWDYSKKWIYPNIETLAVDLPGERSCEERIRASLILNSILEEYYKRDMRDCLVLLCVKYHIAIEIGLDPRKLFEEVAKISSKEFAIELRDFIERPDADKALEAFGWKRVVENDGKVYFKLSL
jgi:hypothetical protein